jgi:hypothetical protein
VDVESRHANPPLPSVVGTSEQYRRHRFAPPSDGLGLCDAGLASVVAVDLERRRPEAELGGIVADGGGWIGRELTAAATP